MAAGGKKTRRSYSDTQRENAVAIAAEKGLANASRELDIPKSTIKGWADDRGIIVADEAMVAKVEKATAMSKATRLQKVEETTGRLQLLFAAIAELGAHAQIEKLKKPGDLSMVELVGATTRAVHDLNLLMGKPTEITEDVTEDDIRRLRDELQAIAETEQGQ